MGLNSSQYWMQYLALRDGKSAGFPLHKELEQEGGTSSKPLEIPSSKEGNEEKDAPTELH
ncbi:hypothetical protein [Rhizobium sp. LC145]|uniref:hypothetical protein n=1 Tax=Rhizobium sp. LC145 TaxID=1120688 RepID=UPI000629E7AA|nr:hypothetical protein [Rhizobium sp. LC145]KKX33959.1 hypothetical protein YH62_01945 [Rhizobium sp. LC145]